MCLLTVFPMPDLLDDKTIGRLYNGADSNPDGHGWAVVAGNRMLVGHSMSEDDAIQAFADAYREFATGPALFHSRFATHGTTNLANTHPFKAGNLTDTYVAHNGILPKDAHPGEGDWRSDTRIFAEDILPKKYVRLDSPKVRGHLDDWMGYNKIAVLTVNPRFRRNLYLFGIDRGEFADGVWFSNDDYNGRYRRWFARQEAASSFGYGGWSGLGSGGWDVDDAVPATSVPAADSSSDDDDEACVWCHMKTVNVANVCECCGTCQDCYEPYRECQCYYAGEFPRVPILGPTRPREDEPSQATTGAEVVLFQRASEK